MSALMIFPFNDCFFYYETGVRGPKTTTQEKYKKIENKVALSLQFLIHKIPALVDLSPIFSLVHSTPLNYI